MSVTKAFASPITAPKIGCLPELVDDKFGWLYEPGDLKSLATAMRLAASSDVQSVGKRAYEKISLRSPDRFAKQTIEAYAVSAKSVR